jgi:hypothetical protein
VLLDWASGSNAFLAEVHASGARLLCRAKSARTPEVLCHLPDGSYLSRLDGLDVRIIEADVMMTGAGKTRIGDCYRLITTLLDPARYPDNDLPADRFGAYQEDGPSKSPHDSLSASAFGLRWPRAAERIVSGP